MKTKINFFLMLCCLISVVVFNGCKKDPDTTPENTMQKFSFHLHTNVGSQEADYSTTFTDQAGRKFMLSDFRYYLSNIVLLKSDGSELPLTGKVLLADPAIHDYELMDVPVGDYKGLRFLFGLDSATNHTDPALYPAVNPLSIQSPGIHWDWNSGYIFAKIEGICDTTLSGAGAANYPFIYHIGMDMMKRTVDLSNQPFSVKSGTDKEIVLDLDVLDVLSNVDLRTENETHTFNDVPLATKIADNFSIAFTVE